MTPSLLGRAVITGASRGIGAATALKLAERGVDVALLARTPGDLEDVAQKARAAGARAFAYVCDVTCEAAVKETARLVLRDLGTPTVVINNAGAIRRAPILETSLEGFRAVVDANLTSTFLVTRTFLPPMLEARRGRFVQIASISATLGTSGAASYCAAKWGIVGFGKSLAEELRGTGLSALSVLPGSVDTAMLAGSGFAPAMTPEEIAGPITYAALDAPDAMNGSSLEVFGRHRH